MGGWAGLKLLGLGILLVVSMAACGGDDVQPAPNPTVASPTAAPTPAPTDPPAPTRTTAPVVSIVASTVAPSPTVAPVPTQTPTPVPTDVPPPPPTLAPDPTPQATLVPSTQPPHIFIGAASLDGTLAPAGTVIAAYVQGQEVSLGIVAEDGKFSAIVVPFQNQAVVFAVGGYPAAQVHPQTVIGGATLMDLTACTGGLAPGPPPPDPASALTTC